MAFTSGTYVRALVWDSSTDSSLEHFGIVTQVTDHPSGQLVEIQSVAGTSVIALASRVTHLRVNTAAGIDVWMDAVESVLRTSETRA